MKIFIKNINFQLYELRERGVGESDYVPEYPNVDALIVSETMQLPLTEMLTPQEMESINAALAPVIERIKKNITSWWKPEES